MADADADISMLPESLRLEKEAIERGGRLHSVHWGIICLSLLLTILAWQYSAKQVQNLTEERFARYSAQAVEMIVERMGRYEDALWSGVATIYANGGDIPYPAWKVFVDSTRIREKYPGINGLGVIHRVPPEKLQTYLAGQRKYRPGYRIHPPHDRPVNFPITLIEPVAKNSAAVGLDMAHEDNRYTAVLKAGETGRAQITGPIVLVQDDAKTPGFLFYAPFYEGGQPEARKGDSADFAGVVYAPFIMKNLMAGTLATQRRLVSVRISDGSEVLYDEDTAAAPDVNPDPLFRKTLALDMYGRNWTFDIASTKAFHASYASNQPAFILAGGIVVEGLLLLLFWTLTRANRRASGFALRMSANFQTKAAELEKTVGKLAESNGELERFAYVASHDLQEPVRMVRSFTGLLQEKYADRVDDQGRKYMDIAASSAARMHIMISDLLEYARVGTEAVRFEPVDMNVAFDNVLQNLRDTIETSNAQVTSEPLPKVLMSPSRISRLLQNLVGNGLKYQADGAVPKIRVSAVRQGDKWVFCVRDNGIGINRDFLSQVFQPFRRLHSNAEYPGSGIGLAICRKIVEDAGGEIWVESEEGQGTRFFFSLPVVDKSSETGMAGESVS